MGPEQQQLERRLLIVVRVDPCARGTRASSRRKLGELSEYGRKLRFEFIELGTNHVLGRLTH